MAVIEWDKIGERRYQTGVDRGVLYLADGSGVPWNGLVSVSESTNREEKTFYMDGLKYHEHQLPREFEADLRAFTYPDEFDAINGIVLDDQVFFHEQMPSRFGLTYRTRLGDDVSGLDRGYKIHILWDLLANPTDNSYESLGEAIAPNVFGWKLSGIPQKATGHRPTCHVSIDSTKIDPGYLELIENKLYGTTTTAPSLPTLLELLHMDDIAIVDNGDGTWTAAGPDYLVYMTDATTFQIDDANATYSDPDTYTISDTI